MQTYYAALLPPLFLGCFTLLAAGCAMPGPGELETPPAQSSVDASDATAVSEVITPSAEPSTIPEPAQALVRIPNDLVIARSDGQQADALRWDGQVWATLIPSSTLPAIIAGGFEHSPEILAMLPDSEMRRIGLSVQYCSGSIEVSHPCFYRDYVYLIESQHLLPLMAQDGAGLRPFRWSAEGGLFVERSADRGLALYDVETGELEAREIPFSDYTLPSPPAGLSADEDLLAISEEDGEVVWSFRRAEPARIPPPVSSANTPWMVFSPELPPASPKLALVILKQSSMLNAGLLRIYDTGSGQIESVPTDAAIPFDLNPVWIDSQRLAFLRSDGAAWKALLSTPTASSEDMPTAVMVYELGADSPSEILPADASRSQLAAPDPQGPLVYLERDVDGQRAWSIAISGGRPQPLIPEDAQMQHTAIAWPGQGQVSSTMPGRPAEQGGSAP